MLRVFLALALVLLTVPLRANEAVAQDVADMAPRDGWVVIRTPHDFATLVERTDAAVADHGMAVVTRAGPTGAAANRGITIPGNMVVGVFNNDFAVRILRLSTPAMILAPMRLYLTENTDGTATLSFIRPTVQMMPFAVEPGEELLDIAVELEEIFAAIAEDAAAR